MTHSYMWHDSFIWVTWLIHMCGMTHDSFKCESWLIQSLLSESCHIYEWVVSHFCCGYRATSQGLLDWFEIYPISVYIYVHKCICDMGTLVTCPCLVTHTNKSFHTYEWVMVRNTSNVPMSHIWMSHVTSCHTYEWVMSHIWMRHVTHMNESCHSFEWVMSHIWMSHVTYMNDSRFEIHLTCPCHTHEWVISHVWMSHGLKYI